MNKTEFKSIILSHKGGFLLSSGDENGDCSLSVEFSSVFFDSAALLGEDWLTFQNKLDVKEKDGKHVGDIYALGSTSVNLEDLKSITEHDGDYLIDRFSGRVQRMFTLQLEDECGIGTWLCIGLL